MWAAAATPHSGGGTGEGRTRFYVLQNYYLRQGSQLARLNELMGQRLLPSLNKYHPGPKIFLEGLVAAHMPQFAAIFGLHSIDEWTSIQSSLQQDDTARKALQQWEDAPEPPYEHFSSALLKAANYSPEVIAASSQKASRIFELRVYHSPTWKQLAALHQRFAGPEINIFHRLGINPILYSETLFGPSMPNLTYLTPFENLSAREKAWEAFGADPEWLKVRKESTDAHGQIASVIQISLFKATAYSPVR